MIRRRVGESSRRMSGAVVGGIDRNPLRRDRHRYRPIRAASGPPTPVRPATREPRRPGAARGTRRRTPASPGSSTFMIGHRLEVCGQDSHLQARREVEARSRAGEGCGTGGAVAREQASAATAAKTQQSGHRASFPHHVEKPSSVWATRLADKRPRKSRSGTGLDVIAKDLEHRHERNGREAPGDHPQQPKKTSPTKTTTG